MLEALPSGESQFHMNAANVMSWQGKSETILAELTEQYDFVGGSFEEYFKYFRRADLPKSMWAWDRFSEVKAISGFSAVPKKHPAAQSKLLMSAPFNYLVVDVRERSLLGMDGAGALCRHMSLPTTRSFLHAMSLTPSRVF